MWDMSTFVIIALLRLHSDEILYFGTYKISVTHLSRVFSSGGCCLYRFQDLVVELLMVLMHVDCIGVHGNYHCQVGLW